MYSYQAPLYSLPDNNNIIIYNNKHSVTMTCDISCVNKMHAKHTCSLRRSPASICVPLKCC